jgi:hypothetical protein
MAQRNVQLLSDSGLRGVSGRCSECPSRVALSGLVRAHDVVRQRLDRRRSRAFVLADYSGPVGTPNAEGPFTSGSPKCRVQAVGSSNLIR